MVLRDHMRSIIYSLCRQLPSCTHILEVETLEICERVNLALQRSSLPFDVEFDCLEAINFGTPVKSKYDFLVR